MININNITKKLISLLMIFGVASSMVSCSNELKDVKYTPNNNNITFESAESAILLDGKDVIVKIKRGVADQSVKLDIAMVDPAGLYTLSTPSINFEAGVYTKDIVLKYDISKIKPLLQYDFKLSFSEEHKAITGFATFLGKAQMPLEFGDYGTISFVEGSFRSSVPAEKRSYKLQLAKYTTNYYRIVSMYGSTINMEFTLKGGLAYISEPKTSFYNADDVKDYPLHKFVTAANHASYGIMTAWVDSDSKASSWTGLGADDKIIKGTKLSLRAFYTVSAGFFGWKYDLFEVTEIK